MPINAAVEHVDAPRAYSCSIMNYREDHRAEIFRGNCKEGHAEIPKKFRKKDREGETSNVVTTTRGAKPAKLHFLRMFRVI